MARSATDYLRMLQSLLPWGKAWARDPDAILTGFLTGEAQELARIDDRSQELLEERNTITTDELLNEHEIELGLPDECSQVYTLSADERRKTARAKLVSTGQQNKEYFIEIAERYGFEASITEYTPAWSGIACAGDPCGDQTNIFYWTLVLTLTDEIIYFRCGVGACGDPLQRVTDLMHVVYCFADKYKPAHTYMIQGADGYAFSTAFSDAFDSFPSDYVDYLTGAFGQGFSLAFDVNHGGAFNVDAFSIAFNKPQ